MSRTHELQDATGAIARIRGSGVHAGEIWHVDTTTPTDGQGGYGKGCIWQNLNGTAGTTLYLNEGTNTSTTWLNIA